MTLIARRLLFLAAVVLLPLSAYAQDNRLAPRMVGDASAPVRVIEFVSFTCPHCAKFHTDILPVLKQRYVETGRVSIELHELPLNGPDLAAAMLARCGPEERYFPFADALFSSQREWAYADSPLGALTAYARLNGMSAADVQQCLSDTSLREGLLKRKETAMGKHGLTGTPSVVVDGVVVDPPTLEAISSAIDRALAAR